MSNIYIQEPPTDGKVLLLTTVGDIDIELWSRECPRACRNFIQLCMEGYYNDTIFHRVVPEFIVQGGDPTGTGDGGESIYGKPFRDEIHSRLRFVRRGLVAMANAGKDDNSSQFFFTLGPTQELQGKHTIFGKVTGVTIYNMIKLAEAEIGPDDRPVDPHKINKTKILHNPFDDIIPREIERKPTSEGESKKKKSTAKATKNFSLLSFGDEAEEDEEQTVKVAKKLKKNVGGGSKSSHDLLDDERLSTLPAVDPALLREQADKRSTQQGSDDDDDERETTAERIRKKLRTEATSKDFLVDDGSSEDEQKQKSETMMKLKKESNRLKRELLAKDKQKEAENIKKDSDAEEEGDNEYVKQYKANQRKYKEQKRANSKKTRSKREEDTLAQLAAFQNKLSSLAQFADYNDADEKDDDDDLADDDISWMNHKLTFEESKRQALDANVAELNRYELFDPRNPLTKRRREQSKQQMKEGKKQAT